MRTRVHEYGGGAWTLVAGRPRPLRRLRRPAALPAAARRGAGRDHARARDAPAALRYADCRARRRTARTVVCVREVHGEGEAENEIVAAAARRLRRAARCSPPAATSTPSRGSAPTARWLAWTCWDHPNMPWDGTELWVAPLDDTGATRAWSPAARRSRSSSPSGTPRAACTSSPTATAGGTSTATRARTTVAADRRGGRARPPAVALRRLDLRLPRRRLDRLRPLRARRGTALPARARRPSACATSACPTPPSASPRSRPAARSVAFAAASPERETAVVVYDVASGELEVVRTRQRASRSTPPTSRVPRADRVPDQRRRDRPRLLLPAGQPRLRGAGGRAAAADRRRATAGRPPTRPPRSTASSSTGPAAASASSTSTTAAAPATAAPTASACAAAGASSTSRTASPPRRYLAEQRRGRRRAAGDPRRQRRRLHDPLRARLPRRLRRRRQLLRRRRRRGPGRRHPQVRVALPRRPDRPLSRAKPTSTASARRSTSSSGCGRR